MKNTKQFIAEVKNNVDPLVQGRVQIYIPHLMADFLPPQYPWARQDREASSNIPEIGDYVWVYFADEDIHKKPYYGNKVTLSANHDHIEFSTNVQPNIFDGAGLPFSGVYPNVKFIHFANGINIAVNASAAVAEISIYHPQGSYIFLNSLGKLTITSALGGAIEPAVLGTMLTTWLLSHNHTTSVGPTTGLNPVSISSINTILSLGVEHN